MLSVHESSALQIPDQLKDEKRWLRLKKGTKKPSAQNWNNSANWMTHEYATGGGYGVGFVLGDGYVGFDWDNVIGPDGAIPDEVRETLNRIGSYSEFSRSGKGIHGIAKVAPGTQLRPITPASKAHKEAGFEFYAHNRQFVLTGDVIGDFTEVREATNEVKAIIDPFFPDVGATVHEDWRHWSFKRPDLDEDVVLQSAAAYASKMDPAVEGAGGSIQLMKVCAALAWGFNLDEHEALILLGEYNERCVPPFDERSESGPDSLLKKLRDSYQKVEREHRQGKLLEKITSPHKFAGVTLGSIWSLAEQPVEWLVEDVFAADQPSVFGARKKSLKTTLLMDLAVALASGTPWLGKYAVPRRRRVLFITGETSKRAVSRRFRYPCRCRSLGPDDIADWLRIESVQFPKLPQIEDCDLVKRAIDDFEVDVVMLDPLYRGMTGDVNSGNVFEMGDALGQFMNICLPASSIISHHVKKTAIKRAGEPPDLDDLSGAGLAEFAGNYWLMDRLTPYKGDGIHDLAVGYGGRDEQFGQFRMKFDEHRWRCDISSLSEHFEEQKAAKESGKVQDMVSRIHSVLGRYPNGLSESRIADACSTKAVRTVFVDAVRSLEASDVVVYLPEFRSGNRKCRGWRLSGSDDSCPD